jgi:hypothetical protein
MRRTGLTTHVHAWLTGGGLVLALAMIASAPGSAALAASPAPSAPTKDSLATVQAWLDASSITPDAPKGGFVQVGFTFWDTAAHDFAPIDGVYARLHPGKGNAAPSPAKIEADFPGHVVATFEVPAGGPGALEVGVHGQACTAAGACVPATISLRISGTGPPPDAQPLSLVSATYHDFVGDLVAARAFPVAVDIAPRGLWDFDALHLPTTFTAVAVASDGTRVATADLTEAGDVGTPWTGSMTIPDTGDVTLTVEIPGDGGGGATLPGPPKSVTIIEAGIRPSTAPAPSDLAVPAPAPAAPAAPSGDIPIFVWILAGAVLVGGGGYLLLRYLADQ